MTSALASRTAPFAAAVARRRHERAALGRRALDELTFEELGAEIARLLCDELDIGACRVWRRFGGVELMAEAGANLPEVTAPPRPGRANGRMELPDGVVFDVSAAGESIAAIALHSDPRPEPSALDVQLIEDLGQLLVSSIHHHRSRDRAARAERRYRDLVERLPVVSYRAEYGVEGEWLYVSPQVEQLLGYTPEEWLADRNLWWSRVHPDDRARVKAHEERCARTLVPLAIEYRMLARDGSVVWIRDEGALGRPVDGGAVQVEGVLTDVTERRRAEEELRHRAEHDELTGLANRRRFADELHRRRAREDPAGAVVIVDVDDLKYVNDSLGHAAGDSLLRAVASSLRSALEPGDFLARFGGDEFTVILEASAELEIRHRVASLLRAVRRRHSRTPARASAGAVPFDATTESTDEELLVAADIALHEAKERGGDRYQMFEGSGVERLAWVGHVRSAIDEDRLSLYAQPIVDLQTGRPAGREALVRMVEPDGSVLSASAFLPTAERFGLIHEIDRWVVERAIELATDGDPVTINLSARSISDPELTTWIGTVLERTGVDPDNVVFELTETAAATAGAELREFGLRVERLGCALAIDDFGTGFGSLTYLKHLPIRFLKIDMEFVGGISESAADGAIVESIVTIADSLGMRTIGEGVEDAATLERLRALGVDFAQGDHLGRPARI